MTTHPHHHHHEEKHFRSSDSVRDVVIGMADGLTVPFALAAGLSAVAASRVIVVAGLAEIAAGSIAMGLGGYLAARSDSEHYASERHREETEIVEKPDAERREVLEILESYGLTREESQPILNAFEAKPKVWVDWMMRFELGLEEPDPRRALTSAATIAGIVYRGRADSAGALYADDAGERGARMVGSGDGGGAGGVRVCEGSVHGSASTEERGADYDHRRACCGGGLLDRQIVFVARYKVLGGTL